MLFMQDLAIAFLEPACRFCEQQDRSGAAEQSGLLRQPLRPAPEADDYVQHRQPLHRQGRPRVRGNPAPRGQGKSQEG